MFNPKIVICERCLAEFKPYIKDGVRYEYVDDECISINSKQIRCPKCGVHFNYLDDVWFSSDNRKLKVLS